MELAHRDVKIVIITISKYLNKKYKHNEERNRNRRYKK